MLSQIENCEEPEGWTINSWKENMKGKRLRKEGESYENDLKESLLEPRIIK